MTHDLPNRFPLGGVKDGFAVDIRAGPSQPTDIQRSPRNDQIYGQTVLKAVQGLESSLFNVAPGFQHSEEDFDHPAHAVVLDDRADLLGSFYGQAGQQAPLDRHVIGRGVDLFYEHNIDCNCRKVGVALPGRAKGDTRRADFDACGA